MTDGERRAAVEEYLRRLDIAAGDLPPAARRELRESIREHVEEAWDASPRRDRTALATILDRLGAPEAVARAAAEGSAPRARTPVAPSGTADARAVADGCGVLLTRLAVVLLLAIGFLLSASIPPAAIVLGALSLVVAVWGYRHRRALGWGWVVVPALLGALWLGAAARRLDVSSGGDIAPLATFQATPADIEP